MPTLKRSYGVGELLGQVLRQGPPGRVALMGTGGLSHWVGSDERRAFLRQAAGTRFGHEQEFPLVLGECGRINEQFGRRPVPTRLSRADGLRGREAYGRG